MSRQHLPFVDHHVNQVYAQYIQPLNQDVFEILESRTKSLGVDLSRSRILDFGCNAGNMIATARGRISPENYVGVDISARAIAQARQNHPAFEWIHYDKFNNAFNPTGRKELSMPQIGTFDLVVAYGVFTHFFIGEIRRTIDELWSHLRPGGFLVFSIWEDVDYYGYLGFLDRQLGINVKLPKPEYFRNGFVLLNRERLLVDVEEGDEDTYTWVESFYRESFLRQEWPEVKRLSGIASKHAVYALQKSTGK